MMNVTTLVFALCNRNTAKNKHSNIELQQIRTLIVAKFVFRIHSPRCALFTDTKSPFSWNIKQTDEDDKNFTLISSESPETVISHCIANCVKNDSHQLFQIFLVVPDGNRDYWKKMGQKFDHKCHIIFIGPVILSLTVDQYLKMRLEQVRRTNEQKDDIKTEDIEHALLSAVVAFDFLACAPHKTLTLNNSKIFTAIFLLYNRARISNIKAKFMDKVASGVFSALPRPDKVDFSIRLKIEKEMLHLQPIAVDSLRAEFERKPLPNIRHHLEVWSSAFSKWYKVSRVLCTADQEHLLMCMYAKLHVLDRIADDLDVLLQCLDVGGVVKM